VYSDSRELSNQKKNVVNTNLEHKAAKLGSNLQNEKINRFDLLKRKKLNILNEY
jgi:hypothetical protein